MITTIPVTSDYKPRRYEPAFCRRIQQLRLASDCYYTKYRRKIASFVNFKQTAPNKVIGTLPDNSAGEWKGAQIHDFKILIDILNLKLFNAVNVITGRGKDPKTPIFKLESMTPVGKKVTVDE